MADKLTFQDMTFQFLEENFKLVASRRESLFPELPGVVPSALLTGFIKRHLRRHMYNELARAMRLVDPVLSELETLRPDSFATLPGPRLEVKGVEGLCGVPDFVLTRDPNGYKVLPIAAIVEAKRGEIEDGLPQCAAELYAAYLLNGKRPARLYGCVTNGTDWQFLRLSAAEGRLEVDPDLYFINDLPRLLAVLCYLIDTTVVLFDESQPVSLLPSHGASPSPRPQA